MSTPLCFNVHSFLENLESRNKGYGSPGPANGQSPSSGSQSPIVPPSGASTGSSSPSTPQAPIASQTVPQSPSMPASSPPPPSTALSTAASPTVDSQPPAQSPEHIQPSGSSAGPALQKRSFISRWFGLPPAETTSSANQGTTVHLQKSVPVKMFHFGTSYFLFTLGIHQYHFAFQDSQILTRVLDKAFTCDIIPSQFHPIE